MDALSLASLYIAHDETCPGGSSCACPFDVYLKTLARRRRRGISKESAERMLRRLSPVLGHLDRECRSSCSCGLDPLLASLFADVAESLVVNMCSTCGGVFDDELIERFERYRIKTEARLDSTPAELAELNALRVDKRRSDWLSCPTRYCKGYHERRLTRL